MGFKSVMTVIVLFSLKSLLIEQTFDQINSGHDHLILFIQDYNIVGVLLFFKIEKCNLRKFNYYL